MNLWLYNDSWDDFRKTLAFIGFRSAAERSAISTGDMVVYASSGIVAGIFEAGEYYEKVFSGWAVERSFQVALKPLIVPELGLVARPLRYKAQLEKPFRGSENLFALSEQEFSKIELAIRDGKKELVY